jgi:dihydropteroate synthase
MAHGPACPPPTAPAPAKGIVRLGERTLALEPGRPLLMGILNVSPESFSDGGRDRGLGAQLHRGRKLIK